jgi:hypothetical protein
MPKITRTLLVEIEVEADEDGFTSIDDQNKVTKIAEQIWNINGVSSVSSVSL